LNKKRILTGLTISLLVLQMLFFFSIPFTKADTDIPSDYSQSLNLDTNYIYNVTFWGGEDPAVIYWWGYDWNHYGDLNSSIGGEMHVNYTGFYDKYDGSAGGWADSSVFPNPVPYINISFYERRSGNLYLNSTFYNRSSSEAGNVLGLTYNNFRPGFLIPTNNFSWLTQQAENQGSGSSETVNVNEYLKMIKIEYQNAGVWKQNTSLIYDKETGVLAWAKVEMQGGAADFEISLYGYEFDYTPFNVDYSRKVDYDDTFIYNVTFWGGEDPAVIYWWGYDWNHYGDLNSSIGGEMHVNYTGFYDKYDGSAGGWADSSVFPNPVPYINISFYEMRSGNLYLNSTFYNRSSSEAGNVLGLTYNNFRPGFLIPTNDFNWLTQQAENEGSGSSEAVNVDEYLKMIKIEYQNTGAWKQNTSLIYDKETGLLIWAKVEMQGGAADFEISLYGYEFDYRRIPNEDYYANYCEMYTYDVNFWGGEDPAVIYWWGYDWNHYGDLNSSAGGEIHVNYTSFYDKYDGSAGGSADSSVFPNPVPYINISFYEMRSGSLYLNSTFYNRSSSEAGNVLGLTYNDFRPGFFIPINDFEWLTQQAENEGSGSSESVNVYEYDYMIKIEYNNTGSWKQNTSLIYDKATGVLAWAKVEMQGGAADFEMALHGYHFNYRDTRKMWENAWKKAFEEAWKRAFEEAFIKAFKEAWQRKIDEAANQIPEIPSIPLNTIIGLSIAGGLGVIAIVAILIRKFKS